MDIFVFLTYWMVNLFLYSHKLFFMSGKGILNTHPVTDSASAPSNNTIGDPGTGFVCFNLVGSNTTLLGTCISGHPTDCVKMQIWGN